MHVVKPTPVKVDISAQPPTFIAPEPYTHEKHGEACRAAAEQGITLVNPFVQYKYAGHGQCARIRSPWVTRDGVQMWSLVVAGPHAYGTMSAAASRVTPCQGVDGRCVCAGEMNEYQAAAAI